MGFMRWFALGDLGQQLDLSEQKREINQLRERMELETSQGIDGAVLQRLVAENKEVKLYVAAIFRALLSKKIVSPDELRGLIDAIDAEDGKSDGGYNGDVRLSADV